MAHMALVTEITRMAEEMTTWRHDIHAHPELAYQEERTSALVADKLESWGIEVHRGLGVTGVVGVVRGREPDGPSIGLRADMDALPMEETTDVAYRSTVQGAFHGCGHDGHTAMLLGAARHLAATRDFAGTVHLIFQPAEEGGAGAQAMIDDGLFERFPCDEVYALHNWPGADAGTIGVRAGPVMAAADTFTITISGRGGHAALPHTTVDPVVVAAHLVLALQTLVSRSTSPLDPAVLSVTCVHAGTADNVIPAAATLTGTVRTFDGDVQDRIEERMARMARDVCAAFGSTAEVAYHRNYPATVNHEQQTEVVRRVATGVVGEDNVFEAEPTMGAEDFSYMLAVRPGCYFFLGQSGDSCTAMVHNPGYDFNDSVLPIGSSMFVRLVEARLGSSGKELSPEEFSLEEPRP
jgi:amidohydrolase